MFVRPATDVGTERVVERLGPKNFLSQQLQPDTRLHIGRHAEQLRIIRWAMERADKDDIAQKPLATASYPRGAGVRQVSSQHDLTVAQVTALPSG